jgi:predicted metal-binding membrane protein
MFALNMVDNNKKIWLLIPMGLILPFIAPNIFAYFEIVKIFAERKKLIK